GMARGAPDAGLIDQHTQRLAGLRLQFLFADFLLSRHETRAALFLHRLGQRVRQLVRRRARDRRIGEAADAVELGLLQEVEELLELGLGLARKAGDEGRAQRYLGADRAPLPDALEHFLAGCRALH